MKEVELQLRFSCDRKLANGVVVYHADAAQEDDHDDEDVKAFALGEDETGSPEVRPNFPSTLGCVYIQRAASVTTWHTQHHWR